MPLILALLAEDHHSVKHVNAKSFSQLYHYDVWQAVSIGESRLIVSSVNLESSLLAIKGRTPFVAQHAYISSPLKIAIYKKHYCRIIILITHYLVSITIRMLLKNILYTIALGAVTLVHGAPAPEQRSPEETSLYEPPIITQCEIQACYPNLFCLPPTRCVNNCCVL